MHNCRLGTWLPAAAALLGHAATRYCATKARRLGFLDVLEKMRERISCGAATQRAAACLLGKPPTWRLHRPVLQAASGLLAEGSYQHGLDSELGAERLMGVCFGGGSAQPSEVGSCAGPRLSGGSLGCPPLGAGASNGGLNLHRVVVGRILNDVALGIALCLPAQAKGGRPAGQSSTSTQ